MKESQKKASSPVNKKEKGSLLDIDIGDDFLGPWKSMSMAGDGMDFDFGTTTKDKKKDFKFDKMDMDFSLDADFGKLSSFKTDMSDLDISSPVKKSGKSTDKSKEAAPSGGEHRAKRDDFAFSFDFDEFADLDFGSTKKKTDEKCDESKDKEGCSNTSGSAGSRDVLAKDVDALEDDDTSSKHPVSKVDTQMDNVKDPGPRNEDDNMKSVTYESSNADEEEIHTTVSSEKIISSSFEEPTQESHSSEERSLDNVSALQEEEFRTSIRMVNPSTGAEQNGNVRHVAELVPNTSSSLENLSSDINLQSQKFEMCKERDDNLPLIGHKNDDNTTKGDSHPKSSMTRGKENLAHGETVDKRNADLVPKLDMSSIDSGSATDGLILEKEKGNIQSKCINKQNGSESEKPQASVSFKLIPDGTKRMGPLLDNPVLGKREFGSKSVETSSKFSGISRPLPNMLNRDMPGQSKNTETVHANVRDNTRHRECLNDDNIKSKNEPKSTTLAHDIGQTKEEPASRGRDQNTVHSNPIRSDVHSSTLTKQPTKDLSKNSLNPGLQATSMKSAYNMGKIVTEKIQKSATKSEMKASAVSSLGTSRAAEPKLKSLNSLLLKGSPSMRNKDQGLNLQGKRVLKKTPSVDIKNQTPPYTPTLKRKTFEASAESPRSTPIKRLSPSPFSNNTSPSLEKAIDKKMRNHADVSHEKSPRLDASLLEINIYSASENDALFEQAEACSKELDLICNMLKKKNEEAKDLLVRAVVNNNDLLMLDHPIYQEKIRMIQKFATSLNLD